MTNTQHTADELRSMAVELATEAEQPTVQSMLRAGADAMDRVKELEEGPANTMRTFTVYRRLDISSTHTKDQVNPPDQPQFEGVVFSDVTIAIKWLTAVRSCAVFQSLEDLQKIHGHPEYGSEWVWHNKARAALGEKP